MTERETLKEMLEKAIRYADTNYKGKHEDGKYCSLMADHLLANGVIVPPCKVGDTVYYLTTVDTEKELNVAEIFCGTVQATSFDGKNIWLSVKYTNGLFYCHISKDFGKTVFLTKEEAEKALKERSEGK